MFEIEISRENLEEIKMFIDSELVSVMDNYGLDISEMGFVLDTLFGKIKEVERTLGDEN